MMYRPALFVGMLLTAAFLAPAVAGSIVAPRGIEVVPGCADDVTLVTTAADGVSNWLPACVAIAAGPAGTEITWAPEPALHRPTSVDTAKCFDGLAAAPGRNLLAPGPIKFQVVVDEDSGEHVLFADGKKCNVSAADGVFTVDYICGFHGAVMPGRVVVTAA